MKILDNKIIDKLTDWIILIPTAIILWLLNKIWEDLQILIPQEAFEQIPNLLIIKALLLSLLVNILVIAYCIYLIVKIKNQQNQLPEPRLFNGIYFDYLINPLCPVCKSGLQVESLPRSKQIIQKPKLICPNDSKHYNQIPTNDLGEELHISTIRHNLISSDPDFK